MAQKLTPRPLPEKPTLTVLTEGDDPSQIVVKFRESTGIRLRSNTLIAPSHVDMKPVYRVLNRHSVRRIRRLFTRPEEDLADERRRAEARSGRELADLNLYYVIDVPPGTAGSVLCDEINALPAVEIAEPALVPAPPPVDLPPRTPDFTGEQGYLSPAPAGIGAAEVGDIPGTDGSGMVIVDVEYSWVLDHEDLELDPSANIDSATLRDPFPEQEGSHGAAVLGVLGAVENRYGVSGIAPGATLLVAPTVTVEYGHNAARAINLATQQLDPGDVILIEQQANVCGLGYGPVEWNQPIFDVIAIASALGIVVVEAAGNGSVDLDQAACLGRFDRATRDSGAIIVGAGSADTRARLALSSFGSRVDVQGWGHLVTTTGYGAAFDPRDSRQRYTYYFSGTSSASAIVAGVVLAINGTLRVRGDEPLSPFELRDLLVSTGTPQASGEAESIGPLPSIPGALDALELARGELDNGVPVTGLAAAQGDELHFWIDVPERAMRLVFKTSGGTGDADLHVKYGGEPTTSSYDCRPYTRANDEICSFDSPSAGTWHVMLRGFTDFADVTLAGRYTLRQRGPRVERH